VPGRLGGEKIKKHIAKPKGLGFEARTSSRSNLERY
jgi:hypothetical protein